MKLHINFLNDEQGNVKAVQIPISDWQKLQEKVIYYEQKLNLRQDLKAAFQDVVLMQKGKKPKQDLADFLNEL